MTILVKIGNAGIMTPCETLYNAREIPYLRDMNFLDILAEQNIKNAAAQGAFANLPGAGKAIDFGDELLIPVETRAINRVLKNSGFLPPEIEQMREAERLREQLARLAAKLTPNDKNQAGLHSPLRSRLYSRLRAIELALTAKRGECGECGLGLNMKPDLSSATDLVYRQKILNKFSGANSHSEEA